MTSETLKSSFRQHNPRKGTETVTVDSNGLLASCFRQHNPRKGTETLGASVDLAYETLNQVSANIIPARGLKHTG